MMKPTASEAMNCVSGFDAALAIDCFEAMWRSLFEASTTRLVSYVCPPKILTMRLPATISSSTWVNAPIAVCTLRAERRRRRPK